MTMSADRQVDPDQTGAVQSGSTVSIDLEDADTDSVASEFRLEFWDNKCVICSRLLAILRTCQKDGGNFLETLLPESLQEIPPLQSTTLPSVTITFPI